MSDFARWILKRWNEYFGWRKNFEKEYRGQVMARDRELIMDLFEAWEWK